jgi:hypothetical protein
MLLNQAKLIYIIASPIEEGEACLAVRQAISN